MGMGKGFPTPAKAPFDELNEYTVWGEFLYSDNAYRITKIEPYNPRQSYTRDCLGIIRAKDELDAWRYATSVIKEALL